MGRSSFAHVRVSRAERAVILDLPRSRCAIPPQEAPWENLALGGIWHKQRGVWESKLNHLAASPERTKDELIPALLYQHRRLPVTVPWQLASEASQSEQPPRKRTV
ncbi:hypothetical protein KTAU_25870 [Thermogemmatispora aurantia]|uniref:Uncharacterized protein n=1 Tax=Thermogemmatispora aurantia TaxID=2045279 RepID=A0A5J4KBA0_9CHLR|nr:hypothetical protein KTAU_25870 [Thermogemmatispora aurantia]